MRRLQLVIAGAGMGGLGAALACAQKGACVQVLERAPALAEVGAGIQLGPNAVRVLQAWGLGDALAAVAAYPLALQSRDALTGQVLATLPLAGRAVACYGAAYAAVHRADLQRVLCDAALAAGVDICLGQSVQSWALEGEGVAVQSHTPSDTHNPLKTQTQVHTQIWADALVAADGLWGRLREPHWGSEGPQRTGHWAYRALLAQADLPAHLRSQNITVWLGPRVHWVQYPVRGGEWLNVVAVVHAPSGGQTPVQAGQGGAADAHWDVPAQAAHLALHMGQVGRDVQERFEAVAQWQCWPLYERAALRHASQMASGRVALLGDAAHPMRPYLAQGTAMALEDAQALARCLDVPANVPAALQRYAQMRWARNARVQQRAQRNGQVFHAQGLQRNLRNAALRLVGGRLMDLPWLYRHTD